MNFLRSVTYIINYKTIVIAILSVFATGLCIEFDIYADFPLTLVGIAIVFPIVFSINSAYKRRERALQALAEIRGYALGIYQSAKNLMDEFRKEDDERLQLKIVELFEALKVFLESPHDKSNEPEKNIYIKLDEISKEVRYLKDQGLAGRFASRLNQYLTRLTVAIDKMKVIFYYRTPRTLRAYSKVFIFSFPVIYAPYFALIATDYTQGLGYVMPVLFSFILISLDNIQEHLEDPYDQIGEDDITMDIDDIKVMLGKDV
ncbi:MAG: hypothetical protein IIB82_06395 [Bacteroidetes bacterium]|nr:hypothetical protein [Bacteroidota bacterium]